jgi:hypothetical protein
VEIALDLGVIVSVVLIPTEILLKIVFVKMDFTMRGIEFAHPVSENVIPVIINLLV